MSNRTKATLLQKKNRAVFNCVESNSRLFWFEPECPERHVFITECPILTQSQSSRFLEIESSIYIPIMMIAANRSSISLSGFCRARNSASPCASRFFSTLFVSDTTAAALNTARSCAVWYSGSAWKKTISLTLIRKSSDSVLYNQLSSVLPRTTRPTDKVVLLAFKNPKLNAFNAPKKTQGDVCFAGYEPWKKRLSDLT